MRIPTLCIVGLLFLASAPLLAAEKARPNFLVILCDDLGYGDLECYGHPQIKTPHLNRLASEGIKLTDCYASAPVCSASRAGLLTGRTPTRVGIYDWIPAKSSMHLKQEEITIAQLLKQAGYQTCHVGKWHLNGKFNSKDQPQPGDQGFTHWMSTQNNAGPSHLNPKNFVRNGQAVGPLEGYSCQLVADEAIRWLKDARTDAPFFQFVCFHEPHEPIASPADLVETYREVMPLKKAEHHANITNMDRAVGRLLQTLADLKLDENTLVLFTSDNGPETLLRYKNAERSFGSPGELRAMKLWLYEGGIRVPGIVRWPAGTKAGQVSSTPVCNTDLLPTFCALAGVALPQDRVFDGASFAPLLTGKAMERSTPLYWHYIAALGEPRAALRHGDYIILGKWPEKTPKDPQSAKTAQLVAFELYNLKTDQKQEHDLATKEPEKLAELQKLLTAKYAEVQAAAPLWDE